jgi:hypothetical protein
MRRWERIVNRYSKIGLENGLRQELEQKFRKMQRPKGKGQAPPRAVQNSKSDAN